MSDNRNSDFEYRNANDPLRCDPAYDPDARAMNATWGWIAAAVFIVVVLAVAFGIGHEPASGPTTASNDVTPPAATRMAPPLSPAPPANITPPAAAPAPFTPTPNASADR
jgi:cell division protein FtsN